MANNELSTTKATLNDLYLERWFRLRNRGMLCWKTKDKKMVPLREMDDEHLLNAIRLNKKVNYID